MSKNTQPTIHHSKLEGLRSLGVAFDFDEHSTLNEHFSVLINEGLPGGYPLTQYLAIGRGGHRNRGASMTDSLHHSPTDARLFEHVPFIVRPVANDLTPTERQSYRMRTVRTYSGTQYAVYWLKRVDLSGSRPKTSIVTISGGRITNTTPYVPPTTSQTPTPITISNNNVNLADGRYLSVETEVVLELNANDVQEIIAACQIVFGNISYATISEVAICAGFEKAITSGGSVPVNEVTHCQVMSFDSPIVPLQGHPKQATFSYGLSNLMPYPAS